MTDTPAVRNDAGQFQKGVSGNPAGRPPGRKNELTTLKQDLEIAVRQTVPADRIARIVNRMAELAEQGDVKAAKLILDKFVSNAGNADDEDGNVPAGIVVRIENATVFAEAQRQKASPTPAVEAEFTEVK